MFHVAKDPFRFPEMDLPKTYDLFPLKIVQLTLLKLLLTFMGLSIYIEQEKAHQSQISAQNRKKLEEVNIRIHYPKVND